MKTKKKTKKNMKYIKNIKKRTKKSNRINKTKNLQRKTKTHGGIHHNKNNINTKNKKGGYLFEIFKNNKNNNNTKKNNNVHLLKNGLPYNPKEWNKNKMEKNAHNCYSYFLNQKEDSFTEDCINEHKKKMKKINNEQSKTKKKKKYIPCGKAQPGSYAKLPKLEKGEFTCKEMNRRIKADNPDIYETTMEKGCNDNEYMGAMVVKPYDTYHFYRLDDDGYWSHKPGATKVSRKDSHGNLISDPKKSARNFGNLTYKKFCHHYCIPKMSKKNSALNK